jgi:hypothetical protein
MNPSSAIDAPSRSVGSWPKCRRCRSTSTLRRAAALSTAASFAVMALFSSTASAVEATVGLGTSASYSVPGGQTVTNTGSSTLGADLGVSPGTAITGFPPGIVGGATHAADAAAGQAQSDLVIGYNDAAGRSPTATVAGDLVGQTLLGGVYRSTSSLLVSGTLTLDAQGDPNTVFIFQVASALTTASASRIALVNSAQACNVYWQVGSSATVGTTSDFKGTILALSSITVTTGATIEGRALARNGSVTLDTNTFTIPGCATTSATTTTAAGTTTTPAGSTTAPGTATSTGTGGSDTSELAQTGASAWVATMVVAGGLLVVTGGGLLILDPRRRSARLARRR